MNIHKRKNLEVFFIAAKHPTLNEQQDSKKLTLFRNGVTSYKNLRVCFLWGSCFSDLTTLWVNAQ